MFIISIAIYSFTKYSHIISSYFESFENIMRSPKQFSCEWISFREKFSGNHRCSHQKGSYLVRFPLNQSISRILANSISATFPIKSMPLLREAKKTLRLQPACRVLQRTMQIGEGQSQGAQLMYVMK